MASTASIAAALKARQHRSHHLLLFLLVLDLALASLEYCAITFGVWLARHNFHFLASGVTLAVLQSLLFLLLAFVYGKTLYRVAVHGAGGGRFATVFSAKLVLFPWVHILLFLSLVALYAIKADIEGGPVTPWARATLRYNALCLHDLPTPVFTIAHDLP